MSKMKDNQYEHNSFVLYKDSRIFIDRLNKEQRGDLLAAIFLYVCDGEILDFNDDGMVQMCFEIIKSYLDRDERKYQEKCRKNKENIEKRWSKTGKQSNTNVYGSKQSNTNCTDKDTDTDTDTDSVSVNDTDTDTVRDTDTDHVDVVSADRQAAAAAAGAEPPACDLFSVNQLLAIVEKNKVNLTNEGVQVFHEEMQESGWILYNYPVEKKGIVKALRGWAKYHPEYGQEQLVKQEPTEKKARSKQTIEDEIYEIASYYISQELFDENEGGHHCLIGKYCPKEDFTNKQLDYMAKEWNIWPKSGKYIEIDEMSDYYFDFNL